MSAQVRTNTPGDRAPADIFADPDVWCDGCNGFVRASGIERGLCWTCRGVPEPDPVAAPITAEERAAVVRVSYHASGSWNLTRDKWHGSDNEWRDLVRTLGGRIGGAAGDRIYEEVCDAMEDDALGRCDADVDLRLREPRP